MQGINAPWRMDTHPSLQEAQAHYQSTEKALRALLPSGAVPAAQDATQQLMTAFTLAQVIAAAQRASQPEPAPTCAPPKRRKAAAGKQRATHKKTSGPPTSSTAGPLINLRPVEVRLLPKCIPVVHQLQVKYKKTFVVCCCLCSVIVCVLSVPLYSHSHRRPHT